MKIKLLLAILCPFGWMTLVLGQAIEIPYQGLPELAIDQLDRWQQTLQGTAKRQKTAHLANDTTVDWGQQILPLVQNARDVNAFYQQLLTMIATAPFADDASLLHLCNGLMQVREVLVQQQLLAPLGLRKFALLLETLVVETLHYRFYLTGKPEVVTFFPQVRAPSWCPSPAKINDQLLCDGDILLSKGDAASSSFIARIADVPGAHSHSTITYLGQSSVLLVEAFIEDGVRLRPIHKDYEQSRKTKLFAYRSKTTALYPLIPLGLERFIDLMEGQLKTNRWEDLLHASAYPYNFSMNAQDDTKFFCSQLPHYIYQLAGNPQFNEEVNPYPTKLWSSVTSPTKKYLLTKFLEAQNRFPAPSDVEINPRFQLVFAEFNTPNLNKDRIMVSLIDALFVILEKNQRYLETFNQLLGELGSRTVDPHKIEDFLQQVSRVLEITLRPESLEVIHKIPENINYKQLIFFSLLNEKLAPKVTNTFLPMENARWESQHQLLAHQEMRTLIYQILDQELQNIIKKLQVHFPNLG